MMAITAAINSAASGMYAQQRRLAATADNIANALSAGYDRRDTRFTTGSAGGVAATVTSAQAQTMDEGTNVDLGKKILQESGLKIIAADDLADAARKITDQLKAAA